MKSTASSMTPQATRLAVFALAITAVLGTPVTAQSVDVDAAINRNNNTARPASSAARPAANRSQPDAVYVDFVAGEYVLVNIAHPEVTIAVSAGDAVPATCTADSAVPVAPVVVVPTYHYFTWHYWRHYWL